MTKQEIKDLIAAKIAGQGSAVDVGGALPVILNAILDNIDTAFDVTDLEFGELTDQQVAELSKHSTLKYFGDDYILLDSQTGWEVCEKSGYFQGTYQYRVYGFDVVWQYNNDRRTYEMKSGQFIIIAANQGPWEIIYFEV